MFFKQIIKPLILKIENRLLHAWKKNGLIISIVLQGKKDYTHL